MAGEGSPGGQLLRGLTVVELAVEPDLAMSLAGKLLADLGADVVVVGAAVPEDDDSAPAAEREWRHLQRLVAAGKSVHPPVADAGPLLAREPVARLVREADVVLAPPAELAARHGAGHDALVALNPDVVLGVAAPFGDDPAFAGWRSSDLVLQAMGGMLSTTGQPGEPPTRIGARVADHLGALYLALGTLAGIVRRNRLGTGRRVSVSLVDSLVSSLNNFVAEYTGKGHLPPPLGNRHLASSPWNLYPAADGYVVICLITDRQWDSLAGLMGHPDLVGHPDFHGQHNRRPRADEIDALVTAWTERRTVEEIVTALGERDVPCGTIAWVDDVLTDPALYERGLLRRSPAGEVALGPLVRIAREVEAGPDRPASAFEGRGDPARGPLDGLRVVEIGVAAAGPVCGRILANLGADVVKIEPAGGEVGRRVPPQVGTTSAVFHLNGGDKRSVCLELTSEPGRSIARRIIERADVVVENLAPGRLASWGLDLADILPRNPGLIWTSVTGFGQAGAGRRARAYDTVVQGASGLLSVTGFPDGMPTKAGISLSDFFGGVSGAFSTMVALVARQAERSRGEAPRGRHVDVSMYATTAWTSLAAWPPYLVHGERPVRSGNQDRYEFWQGLLTCTDGTAAVTVHDERDAAAAAGLVEVPVTDAVSSGRAFEESVLPALEKWAGERSVDEVVRHLQGLPLAAGPVRTVPELLGDPGLRERAVLTTAVHRFDGEVAVMGTPVRFSDVPVHVPRPAPVLGADTRDVLRTVGFSDGEVEELLRDPTVVQA
ncbi:CaiB/BaiF CoA transferase family protein [Blastococcus sp. SYSU D00669]